MAKKLTGDVDLKRIWELLEKILVSGDLPDYSVAVDKQGNEKTLRVPLNKLLSFASISTSFYDNIFKILSNIDDDELSFSLDNLTGNIVLTIPDISGLIAVNNMVDAFKFAGQVSGGHKTVSFSSLGAFNLNDGTSQQMTLTGNLSALSLTNKVNGGSYLIYLIQDVTGSRTIPTPDSSWGKELPNSDAFITGTTDVNMININVRPDGVTTYTNSAYTP